MIKIGIVGDIGSGKSFISQQFRLPVFNADKEVQKIYEKDVNCFKKLRKELPKYIDSFPIKKKDLIKAILSNNQNLKKINKIVHPLVRKKLNTFFLKNIKKKAVVIDIPLLLENKINNKNYTLIFIDAKQNDIQKNLKKRKKYNFKLVNKLKKIQFPLKEKKKVSNYIIENNFRKAEVKKRVQKIKREILEI